MRSRSKRTEEGRILIQNKCALVPKIAVVRKEEGATAAASHLPFLTQRAASFCRRAGRAAFYHGVLQTIGKTPLTTTNVPTTKHRLLDFCLALQNRTNEQKMQLSLTERSDLNIRCNQMTQKQLLHSLFLGCVYTQKIYSIPRGAMLLLVSLWLSKSLVF